MNPQADIQFMLDAYPTTRPSFSLNKVLQADFIEVDAIVIVEDDGLFYTERTYQFQSDGLLPLSQISTDLSFNDGLVTKIYCHNAPSIFYEQTTRANMPKIATAGVIETDAAGKTAMLFSGLQSMSIASSTATYKLLHSGTVSSQLFELEQDGTVTQAFFMTGGFISGSVGWSLFGNNFVANALHFIIRNPSTTIKVSALNNPLAANTSGEVFCTLDLTNATAADRCIVHVNGTEYKVNTSGSTATPPDVNSANNMTMGLFGIFEANGFITSGIFWDDDQSGNRTDILTYL